MTGKGVILWARRGPQSQFGAACGPVPAPTPPPNRSIPSPSCNESRVRLLMASDVQLRACDAAHMSDALYSGGRATS